MSWGESRQVDIFSEFGAEASTCMLNINFINLSASLKRKYTLNFIISNKFGLRACTKNVPKNFSRTQNPKGYLFGEFFFHELFRLLDTKISVKFDQIQ